MPETLSIDGFGPRPVHRPATVKDVGTLVKQQRATKQGVYPVGGRTQLDFGLVPTKPGIALDLTALNKVIDYPARDMTITVEAGITLAELQAVLAKEGQWLPLDAPHPERSTLGGLVATNTSGPRRLGYGTLRDFVIGISFINDNGDEIKGGGRVVKNVAGYDLMKLHTGALGTLGVITQLTLKVRPKPEISRVISCNANNLAPLLNLLHSSKSRPVAVNYYQTSSEVLYIGFEEKQITVTAQLQCLQDELASAKFAPYQEENIDVWQTLMNARYSSPLLGKWNLKSSGVGDAIRQLPRGEFLVQSEAFSGVIWLSAEQTPRFPFDQVVMHKAPAAWKTPEWVFGKPTPAFELMRHIKRTLDPDDVFNPGRMFV